LEAELDAGEAAVIATASARGCLPVLMDERKGRRVASIIYRLPVIGTGGLLVAAKRLGLISTIRPLIEGMRAGGYHLGPTLVAECLRRAGE
jgi:predicted nucleic acid-binding protein